MGEKGEDYTADLVGETAGAEPRTVRRYIRLTYLKSRLLDYADQGRITFAVAEKLSFLNMRGRTGLGITGHFPKYHGSI